MCFNYGYINEKSKTKTIYAAEEDNIFVYY